MNLSDRKQKIYRSIELRRLKRIRKKYVPPYKNCQNCGTLLEGMYCHNCGQFAHDNNQPFWKYIKQYFENVYQFDSKVPITIWQLFRRPGFLTNEFNAGKIASYMHPLKLNMFVLVLFFTVVIFMGKRLVDNEFTQANISGYIKESLKQDKEYYAGKDTTLFFIGNYGLIAQYPDIIKVEKILSSGITSKIKSYEDVISYYTFSDELQGADTLLIKVPVVFLRDAVLVLSKTPVPDSVFDKKNSALSSGELDSAEVDAIRRDVYDDLNRIYFYKVTSERKFVGMDDSIAVQKSNVDDIFSLAKSWLPLIFLLTMPFLAMILKFAYRKMGMNYMSHLVFSLHFSSVMFILLFIVFLLLMAYPQLIVHGFEWYFIILTLYFVIASHTVYTGTGWVKSILKSLFVLMLYFLGVLVILLIVLLSYFE